MQARPDDRRGIPVAEILANAAELRIVTVPVTPGMGNLKKCRAVAQLGRAPRSGRGGREFESLRPDQFSPGHGTAESA